MNCFCLLISPCELIFVLLMVNLHNMIYLINYVNIYACGYISMNVLGLASCIPYALGHPRILEVSARHEIERKMKMFVKGISTADF